MRICLVSSSFYPAIFYGGPISSTWDLSRKLADKDIKMYISTTDANGKSRLKVTVNKFVKKQKNLFVKYYHEQFINKFSVSFIFGVWLDIKKADLVYIQYLFHYTSILSLFFSFLQRKKVIVCPRGSLSRYTLTNKWKLLKYLSINFLIRPFARSVVWQASSYLEKDDILFNFPMAQIKIINDGIDFESFQEFTKTTRVELLKKYTDRNFKNISRIFFSMGRLHQIKRFDVLIDAFSIFLKEYKDSKLLIAGGDDGMLEELTKKINDLGLKDSVFLIGVVEFEDKKILLNNCDYFALASEFESFGIVVAEALACGKPIVASNLTPWKSLEKNKCGILVANDKISFSRGLFDIVNNQYDSKLIKEYVFSNYDWNLIADKFLINIKDN